MACKIVQRSGTHIRRDRSKLAFRIALVCDIADPTFTKYTRASNHLYWRLFGFPNRRPYFSHGNSERRLV